MIAELGITDVLIYEKAPLNGMIDKSKTNHGYIKPLSSIDGPSYDHEPSREQGCLTYMSTRNYFFAVDLCDCLLTSEQAHERIMLFFMKHNMMCLYVTGSSHDPEDVFSFDTGLEDKLWSDKNIYVGVWFQLTSEIENCTGIDQDLCLFKVDEKVFAD